MEYVKLFWLDAPKGEPVVILYEVNVDNERLALRSIDIFRDRHTHNINDLYEGVIEIIPIPTIDEFNNHIWGEEFYASLISQDEFETTWERQYYNGELKYKSK